MMMRRYAVGSAIAVVVLCALGVGGVGLRMPAARAAEDTGQRRVSLDLDGVRLSEALTSLFKDTDQSFMMHPSLDGVGPVTVRLKNVPFEYALKGIVQMHGATYEQVDNLWYVFPDPDVVSVGGVSVPVVGALQVPGMPPNFETGRSIVTKFPRPDLDAGAIQTRLLLSRLPYFDMLVDLEVENAPFTEVAKKLSVEKDGANRTEIIVHESVPSDIRVKARIYRMRRDAIVQMLADQANLDVSVETAVQEGKDGPFTPNRVYLIRKPEIRMSGSGYGFGGGGGGGIGGGIGSGGGGGIGSGGSAE
jgi:uncharacterized membrane protein YgcG